MGHRPYLPVELILPDHPKTRQLAKIWGCHPYMVVGFLVKLWGYCVEFQEDGNVDGRPADVLDNLAAPCTATSIGTMPTVREALERVGFIDPSGELHDWWEYAGALIERRRKDRRRKQLARKRGAEERRQTSSGQPADRRRMSAPRVEQSRVEKSKPTAAAAGGGLDYATRCVIAVNRVLEQRLAGAFSVLTPDAERTTAEAWDAAGIPIALVETTLTEVAARFPNARGRQPRALSYFTSAVQEAFARAQGRAAGPVPLTDAERMLELAAAERARENGATP